jgi:pyruvate dehydrogenase E1 component beta subunit
MLIAAIESNDTILYMEPKRIYRAIKQEVSEEKFTIELGKANVITQGKDVTIVSFGAMIREVQKAMVMAKEQGISVELIDLRSIYPIDRETIRNSVKKTGRIITVTEGPKSFGLGAEIAQIAIEEAFLHLEAPPARVSGYDVIVPLPKGEHHYMQDAYKILYEIEKIVKY